jgi:hypothetical protein
MSAATIKYTNQETCMDEHHGICGPLANTEGIQEIHHTSMSVQQIVNRTPDYGIAFIGNKTYENNRNNWKPSIQVLLHSIIDRIFSLSTTIVEDFVC